MFVQAQSSCTYSNQPVQQHEETVQGLVMVACGRYYYLTLLM